jgi:tRNA threonylcarbamoyladenosine biosynthesis protein TsaE
MEIEFDISNIDTVAEAILRNVHSKIVLFSGSMGSGKTTLIGALIKSLGSPDLVSSPTFALMNEYQGRDSKIYHYDFYRIKNLEEALDIGCDEFIEEDVWNLVEWPGLIVGILPHEYVTIEISRVTDTKRKISVKNTK